MSADTTYAPKPGDAVLTQQSGPGASEAIAALVARSDRQQRLYEAILTNTPDLAYVFDLDHRFIYANEGLLKMWGRTWDEAIGKTCLELGYEPWHAAMHDREIEQVVLTKRPVRGEVPFAGTFGRRIYDYIFVPVFGPHGQVEAIAGTTRDVTEYRLQENALRESEERFRLLAAASFDVIYRMSPDWTEMRHLDGKNVIADTLEPSRAWLDEYIPLDDQQRVLEAVEGAIRSKCIFELEHRIRRLDTTIGWTFSRAIPMLNAQGEIVEWFGAATDITARKDHEERLQLLINELNHRVKNTLATVQSLASQTLRRAANFADGRSAFEARLFALSKAHDILTQEHWEGANLWDLVDEAVAAYSGQSDKPRVIFDGPAIRLRPKAALAMAMALHELATNAVKYGALSNSSGKINVAWEIEGHCLQLLWTERGGPPVVSPIGYGFGSRLIQEGLSQDLSAEVSLDFKPRGVQCAIRARLDAICIPNDTNR